MLFRSTLEVASLGEMVAESRRGSDRSRKNYFGLYPFRWQSDWQDSFQALHCQGQIKVAPILKTLIFNRDPEAVLKWINQITTWGFERLIPAHLEAPIQTDPHHLLAAFDFLKPQDSSPTPLESLATADTQLLRDIDQVLVKVGIAQSSSHHNN